LFWRDAWLKPVGESENSSIRPLTPTKGGCTEVQLLANTQLSVSAEGEKLRYSCQATELYEATQPLAWWDPRQYICDVITGNHSLGHVLRVLSLAFLRHSYRRTPFGYRLLKSLWERTHRWLTGREIPEFQGAIRRGIPTPNRRLDLKPGDLVRIKSKEEIIKTIDWQGRNRGLYYDIEMSRYCGSVVKVRSVVTKIIDELTGEMRHMKEPCIMLEGVVCNSEYSDNRLMCPRSFPSYWREIWLERVEDSQPNSWKAE
jgi:hypothetical protein